MGDNETRVRYVASALGALALLLGAAGWIPAARGGEQRLGTLYTNPQSCPACVSLDRQLAAQGWVPGTQPGTLVNGSSVIGVRHVPLSQGPLPRFVGADGRLATGSTAIADTLQNAAAAHEIAEQAIPPPATETENFLDRLFGNSPDFQRVVQQLIENSARAFASFLQASSLAPGAGHVSQYKNPDPTYLGYGRPGRGYRPPKSVSDASRHKQPKPPAPIRDQSKLGTPGGGKPGDPFWARNCLCHASTGARPDVRYQVTNICPLDLLPCEISVCGPIVRHDNFVSTIGECLRHSDPAHQPFGL